MSWRNYLEEKLANILIYAAQNPYDFLYSVLLYLSPLFAISAFLSWKLAKIIEKEGKDKARKQKRLENKAKARKQD